MEAQITKLGSSLQVPSVQELVKEQPTAVPPRYVRSDQDPTPVISNFLSLHEVPRIDMQKLLDDEDSSDCELKNFHHACKDWGFFQLINHGVNTSLVEKMRLDIQELFELPLEEKKRYVQEAGDVEGYGQIFVFSEEQKLEWADMFYMVTLPTHLRKRHLFPQLPLPLRNTMEAYAIEMKNLAMTILNFVAKALEMNPEDMTTLFEEGMQGMRMGYYPPCPRPDQVIGLSPHSDAVGLTILLQVNETDGLQVRKDGMWIPITPLPNAFIVNIGDMLEIVTNGRYRSIEHRVVVNSEKERLSIATFLSPNIKGDLGPAPSLLSPQTPPLFKRIGVADYLKGFFSRELAGKSYSDALRT